MLVLLQGSVYAAYSLFTGGRVADMYLDMFLQPGDDSGIGVDLAHARHVSPHSQQVRVTALQLSCGGSSTAVVLQQQAQAVQALTCALTQSRSLVWLAQQAAHQELAPLKCLLEALHHACRPRSRTQPSCALTLPSSCQLSLYLCTCADTDHVSSEHCMGHV